MGKGSGSSRWEGCTCSGSKQGYKEEQLVRGERHVGCRHERYTRLHTVCAKMQVVISMLCLNCYELVVIQDLERSSCADSVFTRSSIPSMSMYRFMPWSRFHIFNSFTMLPSAWYTYAR